MPGIDASVSGAASSLLLAHFVFSRRKKDRE
jgi:hypothetical protein